MERQERKGVKGLGGVQRVKGLTPRVQWDTGSTRVSGLRRGESGEVHHRSRDYNRTQPCRVACAECSPVSSPHPHARAPGAPMRHTPGHTFVGKHRLEKDM